MPSVMNTVLIYNILGVFSRGSSSMLRPVSFQPHRCAVEHGLYSGVTMFNVHSLHLGCYALASGTEPVCSVWPRKKSGTSGLDAQRSLASSHYQIGFILYFRICLALEVNPRPVDRAYCLVPLVYKTLALDFLRHVPHPYRVCERNRVLLKGCKSV